MVILLSKIHKVYHSSRYYNIFHPGKQLQKGINFSAKVSLSAFLYDFVFYADDIPDTFFLIFPGFLSVFLKFLNFPLTRTIKWLLF